MNESWELDGAEGLKRALDEGAILPKSRFLAIVRAMMIDEVYIKVRRNPRFLPDARTCVGRCLVIEVHAQASRVGEKASRAVTFLLENAGFRRPSAAQEWPMYTVTFARPSAALVETGA